MAELTNTHYQLSTNLDQTKRAQRADEITLT